jgi:hypothetical protein
MVLPSFQEPIIFGSSRLECLVRLGGFEASAIICTVVLIIIELELE